MNSNDFAKILSSSINKELKSNNIEDDIESNVAIIIKLMGLHEKMYNIIVMNDNTVKLEYVMNDNILLFINSRLKKINYRSHAYRSARRILKAMGFQSKITDYDYLVGKELYSDIELYSDEENNKIILCTRDFVRLIALCR